jgi:NAD dependent epimerase/dehydratase family enzyme
MSWIAIHDAAAALRHIITTEALDGPVNVTAPEPVTNREFTGALGRVLRRPTVFPVPATALRLVFGDMADGTLLASTRVLPERLLRSGYRFQDAELEPALRSLLSQARG